MYEQNLCVLLKTINRSMNTLWYYRKKWTKAVVLFVVEGKKSRYSLYVKSYTKHQIYWTLYFSLVSDDLLYPTLLTY